MFLAIALSFSASGCFFSRTVINDGARNLDTSFIEVGKTHFREVLRKLGAPDIPIKDTRSFKYSATDVRTTGFIARYFLWLPFGWEESVEVDELLIECDLNGRVTYVTRSRRDVVRPPFEDTADRAPSSNKLSSEKPKV